MFVAGLVLMVLAAGLTALDLFGVAPGAGGAVSLTLAFSVALLVGSGVRALVHSRHLRHVHH